MGPHVPTQQTALASLSHVPKTLWTTGQGILYQQNSSTVDYTMEERWKMAAGACPLSQCSRKKASGPQ